MASYCRLHWSQSNWNAGSYIRKFQWLGIPDILIWPDENFEQFNSIDITLVAEIIFLILCNNKKMCSSNYPIF
jgi:hypothetical protein